MKEVGETFEAIAKFFNDLIGAWVPGTVLAFCLIVMHLGPPKLLVVAKAADSTAAGLSLAGILFALGHALLAIHEHGLNPALKFLHIANAFDETGARRRQSFEWFGTLATDARGQGAPQTWDFHDLRNLALSVSAEAASIGRRFMFISLLCKGMGSALAIISVDFLFCLAFTPKLLHPFDQAAPWYIQAVLLFGTAYLLLKQGEAFHARAMTTPFSVAVAEIRLKRETNGAQPVS
jgi:hypothetical protein